jgi:aspartate racemase
VQRDVKVPLLHVLDPLSDAISNAGCQHVAVLGTRHVVESAFLLDRLRKRGIRAEPPSADQAQVIDQLIFSELAHGRFSAAARAQVGGIIASLGAQGFDSCALCCTELPVLLRGQVFDIPLFDTVELHVIAALDALGVQDSQQDSQRDSQHS